MVKSRLQSWVVAAARPLVIGSDGWSGPSLAPGCFVHAQYDRVVRGPVQPDRVGLSSSRPVDSHGRRVGLFLGPAVRSASSRATFSVTPDQGEPDQRSHT